MTDADSIETTDVRGSCAWCDGSLQPHHYVQTVRSSAFVLCSDECLRAKQRADADARARVRRRNLKRFLVVTSLVAACVTPHDAPRWLHKRPAVIAQPSAPAPLEPLPGSFGPDWPPTEASLLD